MAIIKCKMCGGNLILTEGQTVAECEYCGSRQTVPTADNEKKLTLFARANRLRLACEFDKAAGVYESIVAEFPEEAEAYWGLVLCRYGIEYVDDPATGKKIPTCHRSSFDSVLEDSDFEQACENADLLARRVYRDEAKSIEELRKGIIEVSGKEEPYDIFICYKETDETGDRTIDSVIAQDVYDALTEKGYRVFFSRISLEDKLGTEYEPYIFAALNSAKIMLAFGTDYEYFSAVWVKNEWSRFLKLMAADKTKHLIPCYKGIDAYDMPKEFARLQAQDMGKVGAIQDLMRGIEKIIGGRQESASLASEMLLAYQSVGGNNLDSLLKRGNMYLEDCSWDKALEYFDRILDLNAEYAQAYLGKAMVEYHAKDLSALGTAFLSCADKPKITSGMIAENTEHIQKMVEKYRVDTHFTAARVEDAYHQHARTYACMVPDTSRYCEAVKASINDNRNLARYRQFAGEQELNALNQLIASVYQELERIIAEAENSDQRAKEQAEAEYQAFLEETDAQMCQKAQEYRESYEELLRQMDAVRETVDEGAFLTLQKKINSFGNYRDAADRAKEWEMYCQDFFTKSSEFRKAASLMDMGINNGGVRKLEQAKILFEGLGDFREAEKKKKHCMDMIVAWKSGIIKMIAVGNSHTVGLQVDGAVVATGTNDSGQCDVSDWTSIVAVSAGWWHTVGLQTDGAVVATGANDDGRCDVSRWTNIVAISAGNYHTAGLRSDGTVVATGSNSLHQCDVSEWSDIVEVCTGGVHTIGLRSDGTVVATGKNNDGQCDVSKWTDIVAISGNTSFTVGLRSDGTVVATGNNNLHQCDVSGWKDILTISAGGFHTVGLRSDGTVVATGSNDHGQCAVSKWTRIVAVGAGLFHTVGLRSDGTVVATGNNDHGQCNVGGWKLFDSFGKMVKKQIADKACHEEKRRYRNEQQKASLEKEKTALQTELTNLKGLFTGKRRKEIETQLEKIDAELSSL